MLIFSPAFEVDDRGIVHLFEKTNETDTNAEHRRVAVELLAHAQRDVIRAIPPTSSRALLILQERVEDAWLDV